MEAKDGRIITLDLQPKYEKDRIRNRIVYYACREVVAQKVTKSKYEDLKNVIITFLLTEASLPATTDNSSIRLHNDKTGEAYSNLLTIHEINIRHISEQNTLEMQILKDFFEIDSQDSFDIFVNKYEKIPYGALPLKCYTSATSDTSLLDDLGEEGKYMYRLSEEERLEGQLKGRQEGRLEVAKTMIKDGLPLETISKYTGLSLSQLQNLSK